MPILLISPIPTVPTRLLSLSTPMEYRPSINKGQMLVEVLLTLGLAAVLLPVLITAWVASRSGQAQQEQRSVATALLIEVQEATRTVRERGWTSFAVNGVWHP